MAILRTDYSYYLPDDLIAEHPVEPRDRSRMMVLNRRDRSIGHHRFFEFPELLEDDSLLVVNNSKVIPARLPGSRKSGGTIELLLVRPGEGQTWWCKVKNSARLRIGEIIILCNGSLEARLQEKNASGDCLIEFLNTGNLLEKLEEIGYAPLPPYIHKVRTAEVDRKKDLDSYRTVYARDYGSIAAPTAGLHFTSDVLEEIRQRNIEIVEITLHVGLGTFEPIRVDDISKHVMHKEWFTITDEVCNRIMAAKDQGRRIVAVGTTSVRTLESAWSDGRLVSGDYETNLFIYPPYRFKVIDQLLTNFHLPESTLLMLVAALTEKDFLFQAYRTAVENRYRFFSYGDCMFIR